MCQACIDTAAVIAAKGDPAKCWVRDAEYHIFLSSVSFSFHLRIIHTSELFYQLKSK